MTTTGDRQMDDDDDEHMTTRTESIGESASDGIDEEVKQNRNEEGNDMDRPMRSLLDDDNSSDSSVEDAEIQR